MAKKARIVETSEEYGISPIRSGTSKTDRATPENSIQLPVEIDAREYRLFQSLDLSRKGYIFASDILSALAQVGLTRDDARLRESMSALDEYGSDDRIGYHQFCRLIRPNILLIERALKGNMVIPDFGVFCREVETIYDQVKQNRTGKITDYIPQLARVDPERFGVALCTIDGQRFALGDSLTDFSVQSASKPITYSLALEEHGEEYVHRYVGREPSGRSFNDLTLGKNGKPQNPMINAGAIMTAAMVKPDKDVADRFDHVMNQWRALCGGEKVRFSNAVYLSERQSADRNFALGYYMREHKAFPEGTDLIETLEFYFQSCAIQVNAEMMSVLAATLANGGVCPTNGERILKTKTVQHCLSMMYSCGMTESSGEFAFTIGLPAKSGVGGVLLVVVPNVMGLCIWSPRLDAHGNSVRGIDFCTRLVETYNFHNYDNLTGLSAKTDPRLGRIQAEAKRVGELIWAASKGDQSAIHRLVVAGTDVKSADYDLRTPLHLAAAEGREQVVAYFIDRGIDLSPRDRWASTPLDDAYRHGHDGVAKLLEQHGAVRGAQAQLGAADDGKRVRVGTMQSAEAGDTIELIYAASKGDMWTIRRLVARGASLTAADYDLRTPLHLAAAEGRKAVVRYFIEQGLDPSPRDRWGGTPLADAMRHNHHKVAEILEKSGATH
ncbi:MAG: glutaminase A [Proteobacteria bacterium]|nr:glutaminase A [Pseudomonadota bacterium]